MARRQLPPWGARPVRCQGNATTVRDEPVQPRHETVSATERRVHPDKAAPQRFKVMHGDEASCWYPRRDVLPGARYVDVKFHAERIEHVRGRVPFVSRANGLFVEAHSTPITGTGTSSGLICRRYSRARRLI